MALFKKPDGTFVDVPDTSIQAAQEAGYTPATEAQLEASRHPIQAGLEGAVEGATFGFGTERLRNAEAGFTNKPQAQVAEEMRLRQQENPKAAAAGNVAGSLATIVATGGEGVAGLAGGGLKGLAVEGTLNGLGQEVTEAALENREVQAEKLAMSGAGGALTGVGFGVAMKGVSSAKSALVNRLGANSLGEAFRNQASSLEAKAIGAEAHPMKEAILEAGHRAGVFGKMSSSLDESAVAKVGQAVKGSEAALEDHISRLESAVPLNNVLRQGLADEVRDSVEQAFANSPEHVSAMKVLSSKLNFIEKKDTMTWKDVWNWAKGLRTEGDTNAAEVAQVVKNKVLDFAADAADSANPGQKVAFYNALENHATNQELHNLLTDKVESMSGVELNPRKMKAALLGFHVGGVVGGVAGAVASKQVERRGALVGAAALRKVSDLSLENGIAGGLSRRLSTILALSPEAFGAARQQIERSMAEGAQSLLATHSQLANGPEGPAYLAMLGYSHETPEEMKGASQKMALLGAIQSHSTAVDGTVDGAIDTMLGTRPGRAPSLSMPNVKGYESRMATVRQIAANPQSVFEQLPPELLGGAPTTSGMAATTVIKAAQFLASKAPRDPNPPGPAAFRTPWQPSNAEKAKWLQYAQAIEEPQKILQQMARGNVTPAQVEALQAVYPLVFSEMKMKIVQRLQGLQKSLPYAKKLALSKVLGPSVLGMSQQQMAILQMTQHAPAGNPQQGGAQGGGGGKDGRQEVDQQKNLQTQSQRLEAR